MAFTRGLVWSMPTRTYINTSKIFQSSFPLELSMHSASASTKSSTATHQIRRYTLEREVCCACRVATVVVTLPLLKLAEISMQKIRLREKGEPLQGNLQGSSHSILVFYIQQLAILVLLVTTGNLTVLVYEILFYPTSIKQSCVHVRTHTHRDTHAKSTPKFYVDISISQKALGLNATK